jgi:exodeoxyribonuclease VII large subunit
MDTENRVSMSNEKIWNVSEVNAAVREVIEGGFHPFWLEAEVGTLNIHRSGHVYLTLKDLKNQVKGVFFGGAEQARALNLKVGAKIEAFGTLTVYQARGEYQFSIKTLRPVGVGDLQRRFEDLKIKLNAEGLFDESLKKTLPLLPQRIGVVTSPGGAAIRDFLQIITRRFPDINIRIYPAAVQGKGAEREIAAGVKFFNATKGADVIIVTRGGGSMEDLWPFNEEILARAIAESDIPVISAVGHEIDFTISDFVADMRVPTPSSAAELVVVRQEEFKEFISSSKRRISSSLELLMERCRRRFERASGSSVFLQPEHLVREHQQRVDELDLRLNRSVDFSIDRYATKLEHLDSGLDNLNPKAVLKRGYSMIIDVESGKAVMDKVPSGTLLKGIVAEAEIDMVAK